MDDDIIKERALAKLCLAGHTVAMSYIPIPTERAKALCLDLQNKLDQYGCLDFEGEGKLSTKNLFTPSQGRMFGVLLAKDEKDAKHIIKAFSGQYEGLWEIPFWAPPLVDSEKFQAATKEYDKSIHQLSEKIDQGQIEYKKERRALSSKCLSKVYDLYHFTCADGVERRLRDAFPLNLPPTGTGECCAPKLLSYAFSQGWKPVSMAEFYYGAPNNSHTREHKMFYEPCQERCRPLIRTMFGLDIIYSDDDIVVVDKSAGLLSVPGKGEDKQDCVTSRLKKVFFKCIAQPSVHRLDMDTSGLLVLALTVEAQRNLSIQFMDGKVQKQYQALLEGIVDGQEGDIELPIRLDVDNRPYQMYDPIQGKYALTHWQKQGVFALANDKVVTRILFTPHTGRTHQLRIHSALREGLGHPIVGDRLYGSSEKGQRLALHACYLHFRHPITGQEMEFTSSSPF